MTDLPIRGTEETRYSKPVRLAGVILAAAIAQDWPKAQRALERLNAECPGPGLGDALVAWCDTFAAHCTGEDSPEFRPIQMLGWDTDSGHLGPEVPEQLRWGMRLIKARAAGDEPAFAALLDELNSVDDGFERGKHVSALVQSIALTMRSLPRGYARMGG